MDNEGKRTQFRLDKSAVCEYDQQQTMNNIVSTCPVIESEGRLQSVHDVEDTIYHSPLDGE